MNTTDQPTSAEQELAFIRKMIDNSRTAAAEDGKPYIVWGLIVAAGILLNYFEALLQVDLYAGYVWIALILSGWISTYWYVRQNKRDPRPKGFADKFQGAIWGACGSTIGLIVLLFGLGSRWSIGPGINPIYTCSIASLILGIAYYLSGYTLEIRWLRNLGFAWWAGAILMYLFANIHVLALYAVMLILFQVVPGILLNRKYKRQLEVV